MLFKNPIPVIEDSYVGSAKPGMIVGILSPEKISEFLQIRNKTFLGLLILIVGFSLSLRQPYKVSLVKSIVLSVILIYFLATIVAGYQRRNLIVSWKDERCHRSWMLNKLLDKSYLYQQYELFGKTNQTQDFLDNTILSLTHIKNALSIDIKITFKHNSMPSLGELEMLQDVIRKDVNNISIFYYFFKPKKLLMDYM